MFAFFEFSTRLQVHVTDDATDGEFMNPHQQTFRAAERKISGMASQAAVILSAY